MCENEKKYDNILNIIKAKRTCYITRITRVINRLDIQEDKYVSRVKIFVKVL